jgi:hypothetical protein
VRPEQLAAVEPPDEVKRLLRELPAALDYGLFGLQIWGVSMSVWLAMSRAYQALAKIFDAACGDRFAGLRDRLRDDLEIFSRLQINLPYDQDVHLKFYQDAYERSWRALRAPVGPPRIADVLAIGSEQPAHRVAADQLRSLLASRLSHGDGADGTAPDIDEVVAVVMQYLREEQAILGASETVLGAVNTLLERPRPRRPFTVRDHRAIFMMAPRVRRFPYLFDVIENELGIRVECTAQTIEISVQ